MVRPKTIYSMKAELLENHNHFLTIQLQTEAGTYPFTRYPKKFFFSKKFLTKNYFTGILKNSFMEI
jgi:hypothetical protein